MAILQRFGKLVVNLDEVVLVSKSTIVLRNGDGWVVADEEADALRAHFPDSGKASDGEEENGDEDA